MLGVINFIAPAIACCDGGIVVRATVDGVGISCMFSSECLEDVNHGQRSKSLERSLAKKYSCLVSLTIKISASKILIGTNWIYTSDL